MTLESLAKKDAPYTRQYTFLRGVYDIGGTVVPYYYTSLTIPDATSDLRLQRDVVLDPKRPIGFAELFQRDVDLGRVKDEIVDDYLLPAHELKFFNALTVVLLPYSASEGRVLPAYPEESPDGAPTVGKGMDPVSVGPVQLQYLKDNHEIGMISWDRDSIKAVIVDGQHRFSALKIAYEDPDFPWRNDLARTSIPVLLLVLDERAGFKQAAADKATVLEGSRKVFIDLNKHARLVNKSRQYLLDDRDLVAVAMRGLIDETIGVEPDSKDDVFDRIATKGQLPVAIVDWQGDSAKFDRSMFLTTTQTLYELTDLTIGRVELAATDRDAAKSVLRELISRLRIDDGEAGFGLQKELQRAIEREEPFSLSRQQIVNIASAFRESRGRLVTRTLSGLQPYKELLSAYEKLGIVNGTLEQWAALDIRGRRAYVEALGPDGEDPEVKVREAWESAKAASPLAFQVVFQKALISAISDSYELRSTYAVLVKEQKLADATEDDFAVAWTVRFNERLGPALTASYKEESSFWQGSVINASGTISYTDAARKALAAAIVYALIAPLDEWKELSEAEAWTRKAFATIKRGAKSNAIQGVQSEYGALWRKSLATLERARLKALDKPIPGLDKLNKLAEKRAAKVLFGLK